MNGTFRPTPRITQIRTRLRGQMTRFVTRFVRAEDGVMLSLVVFMLLIMMVVAGIGVEIMRTEMERTRLQQTIDSATLAAAHKDNTLDPKAVVKDYFAKAKLASYINDSDIKVEGAGTARAVEVRLQANVKTPFLKPLGYDTFSVPAAGRAEQAMGNSEVSLVLDISGSMDENSKMTRLHKAAKEFVDTVLIDDAKDRVSLSVVPYTGDVNAGWEIFRRMNVRQLHNYSYCVQFTQPDFSTTTIDPSKAYLQGQYFSHVDRDFKFISCPTNDYERITPFSQNRTALKAQIDKMTGRERTSIHIGMKWGAGLLDPAFRPLINGLVDNGIVDTAFRDRPSDFGGQTTKIIVVMTDGYNTESNRIKDFAYDTPDMRAFFAKYPLNDLDGVIDSSVRSSLYEVYYTGTLADQMMKNICTAAKNNGIFIYSIGFEIDNTSAGKMQACASSPNHFYRVEGVQISDAFSSIARQLKQLRLTF
ncbi:hypothetical protein GCM10011360_16440 [Primorskyibacter flagellatus]|uniref:VWFA domain-containing protein n=1 Tax=Primorskyibacter flagellatus TaxID=1387277 RepID=A0A917EFZ1_9RHOB|nr:TadE/TadG family type IV pilus assembly protein [Primorskyibacter flagellatus]GGE29009.1 hypothetical protein GCM10011360_16440 [Primorskyibacter flagellatus]